MEAEPFTKTAVNHFINNAGAIGPRGNKLSQEHHTGIFNRVLPHTSRLYNHLKTISGGDLGSGGSLPIGGGFGTGGAITESIPQDPKEMYHHLLANVTPHKFEQMREASAQLLGAVPSPMWDKMTDVNEKLEAPEEEYENIINMPNTHAAARMVEAENQYGDTGGGFFKAMKHVFRKASGAYKIGRAALGLVNRNKDLLLELPGLRDYKEGISGFLETANQLDDAVNPFVDAAIDAVREDSTPQDRDRLKNMAKQSIDKAIETHLPQAQKYIEAAKDVHSTVQTVRKRPIYSARQQEQEPAQ